MYFISKQVDSERRGKQSKSEFKFYTRANRHYLCCGEETVKVNIWLSW